ncbi:MAG TPA: chromate resistance protein ChrB domain-containing protein, partial [Xanthomonadales bacterium]|nr:chromate resistance protein ChrB domain-containing protein [Xanthomonadales bacterium]
ETGAAARIRRTFEAIVARDHFDAPARQEAERLLVRVERGTTKGGGGRDMASRVEVADFRGRTWVTRAGVGVDRIASAWLVQRWVDPRARFRFVRGDNAKLRAGEVGFDMFDAEFTHDGGRCTFEVLRDRFGLAGDGLRRIGEIVHDIDLKDERYARPETAGVAAVIAGICRAAKDTDRLARGAALFDDLLAQLDGKR